MVPRTRAAVATQKASAYETGVLALDLSGCLDERLIDRGQLDRKLFQEVQRVGRPCRAACTRFHPGSTMEETHEREAVRNDAFAHGVPWPGATYRSTPIPPLRRPGSTRSSSDER